MIVKAYVEENLGVMSVIAGYLVGVVIGNIWDATPNLSHILHMVIGVALLVTVSQVMNVVYKNTTARFRGWGFAKGVEFERMRHEGERESHREE